MTGQILALRDRLLAEKVTCVVMEATSDYWKPFYYLLEDGLDVMLVNARDVKNMPGRKSDVSDAAWLADLGRTDWCGPRSSRIRRSDSCGI
jgi:transposase